VQFAAERGRDVILFDTAGRLAIDEPLMEELSQIDARVHPGNILLIVDAMIGQDAVGTAKAFNERLNLDGVILTKLDGDARGGAALSVKAVTGKPIKFVGMGESSDRLEEFRPDGMASRILGRGDVVGLIQQFEDVVDEEKAEQDAVRMLKGKFDMNDFQEQLQVLKKMGPLKEMVEKIPGIADAIPEGAQVSDDELVKIGAMISSMTADERRHPERFIITSWEEVVEGGKRKKKRSAFYESGRLARVAKGSGRRENEVADLLNRFAMMRQMMMQIGMSTGLLGKIPGFKQLAQAKKMMGLDMNQLANMMQTPSAERGHFQAPKRNVDRGKEKRKRKEARKARKKARKRR
jgi:signal recognition particle subunit SRP54